MKLVKDKFGQEAKVGQIVAASTMSYKSAHLRVGRITSISEKGNVTIENCKETGNGKITIKYPPQMVILRSAPDSVVEQLI